MYSFLQDEPTCMYTFTFLLQLHSSFVVLIIKLRKQNQKLRLGNVWEVLITCGLFQTVHWLFIKKLRSYQQVKSHSNTNSLIALTCFYSILLCLLTCCIRALEPPMQHGECQQFDLFPAVDHCPPSLPLSSTGHSFRIYTCHFSSVVNIYELHYCITECVAAVQLSQGAIDPHLWDAEPLSWGDRQQSFGPNTLQGFKLGSGFPL